MQETIQKVGFLRAKNIPGVQRSHQESVLMLWGAFSWWFAGAHNYPPLPKQLLAQDSCNEHTPAAFLRVQSGSKIELSYRNAMLECASHTQMKNCLQYFARCILEQQIFLYLNGMRKIIGSKPYPAADLYIQNAFLLLHFQSMNALVYITRLLLCWSTKSYTFCYQISSHFYDCSQWSYL